MARNLTREKVVKQAAELANELGDVQQLKLKTVAAALNVRVPSLYNHVKGLDGLVHELRIYALTELDERLRDGMAGKLGREAIFAAAHQYRAFAHANPGIYQLVVAAGEPESEVARLSWNTVSLLLLVLGSLGLEGDEALHCVRGLRSLLHGFVTLELAGGFKLDLDLNQSFDQMVAAYLSGLGVGG